jgi:chromosome segregation ATPase
LKFKAGVFENLNEKLNDQMKVLDRKANSNEAKVVYLQDQNANLLADIDKLRSENDELKFMLKDHGANVYKYQSEIDNLEYRDKKLRSELDKTNLDYHKNLLGLRQKLSLDSSKTDRITANYELMLKDKNDIINDL